MISIIKGIFIEYMFFKMKFRYNFVVLQDAHRQLLPHLHDAPQQLFPLPELVDVELGPHIKDDEAYQRLNTFVDSAGSAYLIRKSHATELSRNRDLI